MGVKKTIGVSAIILLFTILLTVGVLFMVASMCPSDYKPYQLTKQRRQHEAQRFVNNYLNNFLNQYNNIIPFTFEISANQMNFFLASLDEIAMLRPNSKSGDNNTGGVYAALDRQGLADPFVKFDDDKLTVMIRVQKHADKIISLDISMKALGDGKMKFALEGVRIGRLPIPKSIVAESLSLVKSELENQNKDDNDIVSMDNLLTKVFTSLDSEPIETKCKIRGKKKYISSIELKDGKLKIQYVPAE